MEVIPSNPMAHSFLLILLFFSITTIQACHQIEHNSVLSFARTLSSPPHLNWTSTNCCGWKGITCNRDGFITHLLLPSKGLKGGMFPPSLKNLTHLTHLNLSHNSLYGSLETQFFLSLNHLKILDLSYNLLYGELPLSLPSRNIQIMDLSSNHFHGVIPSSFFQGAWNLTSLNISNNTFSGSIPSSICLQHSAPLVRLLDFSLNDFSGNISPGFGGCSKLQSFHAGNNNLSGLLPKEMYDITKLKEISLPSNSLYGGISDRIVNLTSLEILDLSYNQLNGVVPLHFGKLSKLKFMSLSFNNLQGSLPPSLMNCSYLREIHMPGLNLEGDISMLNFSKLTHLSKLDLLSNQITGTFPKSLYSCHSLKALRLNANGLEGQIQPEILSLKSLSFLSIGGLSNITGAMKLLKGCKNLHSLVLQGSFKGEKMPADIDDGMVDFDGFQNLRFMVLFDCEFTGQIPPWFGKLKNLEILILTGSRITGPIPSWLGTLPKLFCLSLANNSLSGEFPKQFCELPRLLHEPTRTQVDSYRFELPIFDILVKKPIAYPQIIVYFSPVIVLAGNSLNGNIPTEIGQLQSLHRLDLSNNNFSGSIPNEISNLKNLESFDVSKNGLSGTIPSALTRLNFLKFLNVSYNNLEGEIPKSTQLQSFNASAFERNPKLCGAPLPIECRPTKGVTSDINNQDDDSNGHQVLWFYISVVLGFILGFWGACGSLMVKKMWRYACFRFLDNVHDRLYVMTYRMKRRLR